MLRNNQNRKPRIVLVDESLWRDLLNDILNAIKKKHSGLKTMVFGQVDEYICAGLYTFVLEEFGKLILLARCPQERSKKREIKYATEFANHDAKFSAALDYLEANGFEDAYVLNNEGSFNHKSFSWRSFTIGQLVDFETRLSLFYSDLEEDKKSGCIIISEIPLIDRTFLERAVTIFEKAVNAYNLPP